MHSKHVPRAKALSIALAALLLPGFATGAEPADAAKPAAPAAAAEPAVPAEPAAPVIDAKAKQWLDRMSATLAGAKSYTVTIRSSYDALQPDGSTVSYADRRKISLQRPDKLRIDVTHSDGEETATLYDGKNVTVWVPQDKGYAQIAAPATIDETIAFLVTELRQRVPLGVMFMSGITQQLEENLVGLAYVERSIACGEKLCHHLLGRFETTDFQVWIDDSPQALPKRIYITYRTAPGEPQFRAELTDWNLSPSIAASTFGFTPEKDTTRVPFAVPAAPVAAAEGGTQ